MQQHPLTIRREATLRRCTSGWDAQVDCRCRQRLKPEEGFWLSGAAGPHMSTSQAVWCFQLQITTQRDLSKLEHLTRLTWLSLTACRNHPRLPALRLRDTVVVGLQTWHAVKTAAGGRTPISVTSCRTPRCCMGLGAMSVSPLVLLLHILQMLTEPALHGPFMAAGWCLAHGPVRAAKLHH